jgi:hypothetical protein
MRIGFIGSRNYQHLVLISKIIKKIKAIYDSFTFVSGGARGVDKTAEMFAKSLGLECDIINAEWDKYGKGAGHIRNVKLVDSCNMIVAFWDFISPGTFDALKHAVLNKNIPVIIVYDEQHIFKNF